jgi:hypothetical protein
MSKQSLAITWAALCLALASIFQHLGINILEQRIADLERQVETLSTNESEATGARSGPAPVWAIAARDG